MEMMNFVHLIGSARSNRIELFKKKQYNNLNIRKSSIRSIRKKVKKQS